jgi:hypothetical protein
MKHITSFTFCMATVFFCNAQADTLSKKTIIKNLPQKTNVIQTLKTVAPNKPMEKLPDLKFTAFNVTAVLSSGTTTYTINITCTVKNEGTAPVLTDNVSLQGFISDLAWIQKSQDISFTNHFSAAGGRIMSDIPNRGETLAPGASKQISYSCYNIILVKEVKPVYYITINHFSALPELNKDNNNTYMAILL